MLAQGDAREAAGHLTQLAQLASAEGDDDQAALAALAGARLLRVLEPRSATQLYQLALEHDPGSAEAADSLVDRLSDEQRWSELVRLIRARAQTTADAPRAVQLRLRLADVLVHQLGDVAAAQQELAAARALAPADPAVQEMTAAILTSHDPAAAAAEWREVGRLAETRGDHRTAARAWATLGELIARGAPAGDARSATAAWQRALELDPLQADALAGLAGAAAAAGDHATAAEAYERLRGLGLGQQVAARHELALARSLLALGRGDDARASLRRASLAGGETAAEAHAILAEQAEAAADTGARPPELDTAIGAYAELAGGDRDAGPRLFGRAAELAVARARLLERTAGRAPDRAAAAAAWRRALELAQPHAPALARTAARTLLDRAADPGDERRWIDALLATRPPALERAELLVRRADARRRDLPPELGPALADLREALELTEEMPGEALEATTEARRRAFELEAELRAQSGDQRARAQALASLAQLVEDEAEAPAAEPAAPGGAEQALRRPRPCPRAARGRRPSTASRSRPPPPPPGSPPTIRPPPCPTARARSMRSRPTCPRRPAATRWPRSVRPRGGSARGPTCSARTAG